MGINPFSRHLGKTTFIHPAAAYIMIADVKPGESPGPASGDFVSGAWRTRELNTVLADDTNSVTLVNNRFTIPAGTYRIAASAPAGAVSNHSARLQNISDSTTALTGGDARADYELDENAFYTNSYVVGYFTIAEPKTFEIQHQCGLTRAEVGFGATSAIQDPDVLTRVELFKIA